MNDELTDRLLAAHDLDEGFVCDDDDKAMWALRKLNAAQSDVDRINRNAEAEITRIKEAQADAVRAASRHVEFFTDMLVGYRMRLEAENPDLPKTYKLPTGSLVRSKGRKSTRVVDEDAFLTWALTAAPEVLKVEPRVSRLDDWTRKTEGTQTVIVSPDGERVPGVVEVTGDDRYDVRPADTSPEPF